MGYMIKNINIKISKNILYRSLFSLTIALFIFSEYCYNLKFIDELHIKHISFIFIVGISLLDVVKNQKKLSFGKEFKCIMTSSVILYLISILFQLFQGSFKVYSVSELYYLIMPLIFVILLYNYEDSKNIDYYMDLIFSCCTIAFLINNYDKLSIQNVQAISFLNSASPYESDLAQFFLMLLIYYTYRHKFIKLIFCIILNILTMKRFAYVYMIFFLMIYKFIPKNKKVNPLIINITIGFFIIAPFLVFMMCTDEFANWFLFKFGISFNEFTMTRFEIINTVIDANLTNYGLGTVTDFLEKRNVFRQTNMHNDIMRIYMECTIIGTIVFTYQYFNISKNNYMSYSIMLFIFVELFVAHFLGPGSILFWICAYLLVLYFNKEQHEIGKHITTDININRVHNML